MLNILWYTSAKCKLKLTFTIWTFVKTASLVLNLTIWLLGCVHVLTIICLWLVSVYENITGTTWQNSTMFSWVFYSSNDSHLDFPDSWCCHVESDLCGQAIQVNSTDAKNNSHYVTCQRGPIHVKEFFFLLHGAVLWCDMDMRTVGLLHCRQIPVLLLWTLERAKSGCKICLYNSTPSLWLSPPRMAPPHALERACGPDCRIIGLLIGAMVACRHGEQLATSLDYSACLLSLLSCWLFWSCWAHMASSPAMTVIRLREAHPMGAEDVWMTSERRERKT